MKRERFNDWMMMGLVPIAGMVLGFWLLLQGHALAGWGVASTVLCLMLYYTAFSGARKLRRSEIAARLPACLFSPPLIVLAFGEGSTAERTLALAACLAIILLPWVEQRLYQPGE